MKKNYYEKLGVSPELSCEEIVQAIDEEKYNALTDKQREMFNVITSEDLRYAYDKWLERQLAGSERYDYVNGIWIKETENGITHTIETVNPDAFVSDPAFGTLMREEKTLNNLFSSKEAVKYVKRNERRAKITSLNKKRFLTGVATFAVVTTLSISGIITAISSCNKKNKNDDVTPTPTITTAVTMTPVPTAIPTIKPTQAPTATPTVTPTPTPIVAENVVELNGDTVPVVVEYLTSKNAENNLVIDAEDLKNALLTINMDSIAREEMKELLPSMDIMSINESSDTYVNAVANHNIKNTVYGKKGYTYVNASDLAFNETDRIILSALETYCQTFINSINGGTYELTVEDGKLVEKFVECPKHIKDEFVNEYYTMSRFCEGKGCILVDGVEYRYEDLTPGAKYVLQRNIWPTFSTACMMSEHINKNILEDIKGVTKADMDGVDYLNAFAQYSTATPTPAPQKTLK